MLKNCVLIEEKTSSNYFYQMKQLNLLQNCVIIKGENNT